MTSSTRTISARYGSGRNTADVYVYPQRDGSAWYAIDGSLNVNLAPDEDELQDGVNVEEIADIDTSTAGSPIDSEEALEAHVDDTGESLEDARKRYAYTTEAEVSEAWAELLKEQGQPFENAYRDNDGKLQADGPAEDEAFNNFVDSLQKAGQIPPNYGYHGYDEDDNSTWE